MRKKSKHTSKETHQTTKDNSKRRRKVQKDYKMSRKQSLNANNFISINNSLNGSGLNYQSNDRVAEWIKTKKKTTTKTHPCAAYRDTLQTHGHTQTESEVIERDSPYE